MNKKNVLITVGLVFGLGLFWLWGVAEGSKLALFWV